MGTVRLQVGTRALYLGPHRPLAFDDVPFFPTVPGSPAEAACFQQVSQRLPSLCDPQEKVPLSHDMQAGGGGSAGDGGR